MLATTESAIWDRVIDPDGNQMDPEAIRAILKIRFDQVDIERINELSALAREGRLDADQRAALESYNRVGHTLALLQSKARQALNRRRGL